MNVPQPEDGITFTGTSEGHNISYDFTRLGVRYVPTTHPPLTNENTTNKTELQSPRLLNLPLRARELPHP